MKRSNITLLSGCILCILALGWWTPVMAQPQGTNYDGGVGGGVSIQGVVATGGFSNRIKQDAGLVVDVQEFTAQLNSIEHGSGQREILLTHTNPDGSVNYSVRYIRPGQDLDPAAICEATPGDGYGIVAFDLVNEVSYVAWVDLGGNIQWVSQIKRVIAKDIFLVNDGVTGGPEFVVVGEVKDQTYVGHFELGSGNAVQEVVIQDPGGFPVHVGYCGTYHDNFGAGWYKVVSTDLQDRLFVHTFQQNGAYLGSVVNQFQATVNIAPWRIRVIEPTQELMVVGTSESWGVGTYYGFVSRVDAFGAFQWSNYLSIGASGPLSAFEDVAWNNRTGLINSVGYVTNPASGNRNSIMVLWEYNRNQVAWNQYFPTSSSAAGSDDLFGGIDVYENIDLMAAGGFVFEQNVAPDGLADVYVTNDGGQANCMNTIGTPWDGLNSSDAFTNAQISQVQLADLEGMDEDGFGVQELSCGTPKRLGDQPETPATALEIYPQPAQQSLNLRAEEEHIFGVRIVGMDGRVVLDQRFGQGPAQTELNVSELAPGIYLMEVQGESQVWKEKIVIQ